MDDKQFAGKVAFVTGSSSGIGRSCAIKFATAGARVACVGRDESGLQRIKKEIQSVGAEALEVRADLSIISEADKAVLQTVETFGGIDVLVNAAGHISSGTIENTTLKVWDDMLNVNVRA